MIHPLLRALAAGTSAVAVLGLGSLPAQAAVTDGHQVTEFSRCISDDGAGFTFCVEGVNQGIEVHQPNGRAVFVSSGTATMMFTYANGDVVTVASAYRGVSNFSYWLDGLFYDPQMILSEAATTSTLPDGSSCTSASTALGVGTDQRAVRWQYEVTCTRAG